MPPEPSPAAPEAVRQRADRLLVERGFFASRAKAQAAIAAGLVRIDGRLVRKASEEIDPAGVIMASPEHPYVSRGGLKLAAALDHFGFAVTGAVALDVGASTGGFTQVLLERGARRVYAVDVGTGQLDSGLRDRPEIICLEQTDIRTVDPKRFDPLPDFITIDVSFISLKLVLPAVTALAERPARLVALIKPQFEAGPGGTKKGIVTDAGLRHRVGEEIAALLAALGWEVQGVTPSPITGGDGNIESLIAAIRR